VPERTFTCFGGACTVLVEGDGAAEAVIATRDEMLAWHEVFSRFKPGSELSRLNADPRECVPVSPLMARFAAAAIAAAEATGGLVDPTLLAEIEAAGYDSDRLRGTLALPMALALTPGRAAAGPRPDARWRAISVDLEEQTITRPPGVKLDGGGIVKGLCADVLAESLDGSFAINCEGDLRVGGGERAIQVASPFDGAVLHEYAIGDGGVATSEIAKRSWLGAGTRPAHHLLDPATGRPAYTGVVQATALAPTALEGEALAKAALLSGPDGAAAWLRHGGVLVFDDGSHAVIDESGGPERSQGA
jgi:thiamine biosynthesis lipoprotein